MCYELMSKEGLIRYVHTLKTERDALLDTVKLAYRKHCMNDDSIGWEELGGLLHTALCESLGDDGYCEWLKALEGGE